MRQSRSALALFLLLALFAPPARAGAPEPPRVCAAAPHKDPDSGAGTRPFRVRDGGPLTDHVQYRGAVPPRCLLDDHEAATAVRGALCEPEMLFAGAAVGDYDNDGWPDVLLTAEDAPPRLLRNDGAGGWVDVSGESGIAAAMHGVATTGAGWGDVDNDGDEDLYITSLASRRFHLLLNLGNGSFVEAALERGIAAASPHVHIGASVDFGDYDGDGFLDVYVTEWGADNSNPPIVAKGTRDGEELDERLNEVDRRLREENLVRAVGTGSAARARHGDGPRTRTSRELGIKTIRSAQRLFRNLGHAAPGYFEDVTVAAGVDQDGIGSERLIVHSGDGPYGFASKFLDLDGDGRLDLLVAGDYSTSQLFWNRGDGTFERGDQATMGLGEEQNAMGLAIADVNGDGLQDIFLSGIFDASERCNRDALREWCEFGWIGNRMYLNGGNRTFVDVTDEYGLANADWAWGAAFVDFDNDGDDDLYVVNGFSTPGTTFDDDFNVTPDRFFENPGDGSPWRERAADFGMDRHTLGRAVQPFDFDRDGDLDLLLAVHAGSPVLWENVVGSRNGWLRVSVRHIGVGSARMRVEHATPSLNAVVRVWPTAECKRPMTRVIGVGGAHYLGTGEPVAHFGLGSDAPETVHRVHIAWANMAGAQIELADVPTRQTLAVTAPPLEAHQSLPRESGLVNPSLAWTASGSYGQCPTVLSSLLKPLPQTRAVHLVFGYEARHEPLDESAVAYARSVLPTAEALRPEDRPLPPRAPLALTQNATAMAQLADPAAWYPLSGAGHHTSRPYAGSVGQQLRRIVPADYADERSAPAGSDRPGPRALSNALMAQVGDEDDASGLSELSVSFGQFLSHDLDFSSPLPAMQKRTTFPIAVPKGDPIFDPDGTGEETLRFRRSMFDSKSRPRQQFNKVTAWLDGSMIYGPDEATARSLRAGSSGKACRLQLSSGWQLPFNTNGLANDNPTNRPLHSLRIAGDSRSNAQPGLLMLHTVFAREHNRLCAELETGTLAAASEEVRFHAARRIVIAQLQHITYNEYLPSLFGETDPMRPDTGFDASADPAISNIFATAAFRFGHSQVGRQVRRRAADGSWLEPLRLRDVYFAPEHVASSMDDLLRGMASTPAQRIDLHMVDDLRNFLFHPPPVPRDDVPRRPRDGTAPGGGALDLAASNIQRGRDHGLPSYAAARAAFGLSVPSSWDEAPVPKALAAALGDHAGTPDATDLFVGMLAEDDGAATGAVRGPLLRAMLKEQFERIRAADRLWFERTLPEDVFAKEGKSLLAAIIGRNTGLTSGWSSRGAMFTMPADVHEHDEL